MSLDEPEERTPPSVEKSSSFSSSSTSTLTLTLTFLTRSNQVQQSRGMSSAFVGDGVAVRRDRSHEGQLCAVWQRRARHEVAQEARSRSVRRDLEQERFSDSSNSSFPRFSSSSSSSFFFFFFHFFGAGSFATFPFSLLRDSHCSVPGTGTTGADGPMSLVPGRN